MKKKQGRKLTQQQKARIYCIKHGHAPYIWKSWGYVHCGRCGEQIGDTLASIYPCDNVLVVECKDFPCSICDSVRKKLSAMDRKILKRLEKDHENNKLPFNYSKILKGIDFRERRKEKNKG